MHKNLEATGRRSAFDDLDAVVGDLLARSRAPGLSVAIVTPHETIARGYGVRTVGEPGPVDAHTLHSIASAGKAFTATAVAMLVDEGRLGWDDRMIDRLPGFALNDPYVTRELTVRDLLCHRSGLSRADDLWYGGVYPREEVLRRIRFLSPSWSFRARFGYQNIMFVAAGEIVRAVSGMPWETFVRERIFGPLQIRETRPSVTFVTDFANAMSAHARRDEAIVEVPRYAWDTDAPAGGIYTNATDLVRWLRVNLGSGTLDGTRLLGEAAHAELLEPQIVIPAERPWTLYYPDAHFRCYGLGWFLTDYRGRKLISHGGNTDGMSSVVAFMPEEGIGVAAVGNLLMTGIPYAVLYHVLDACLGARESNRSREILAALDRRADEDAERVRAREARQVTGTRPSLPLDAYCGTYHDELYGDALVKREGNGLVFSFVSYTGDLAHFHYDIFTATPRRPTQENAVLAFTLDERAAPAQLNFSMPPDVSISFARASPQRDAD